MSLMSKKMFKFGSCQKLFDLNMPPGLFARDYVQEVVIPYGVFRFCEILRNLFNLRIIQLFSDVWNTKNLLLPVVSPACKQTNNKRTNNKHTHTKNSKQTNEQKN